MPHRDRGRTHHRSGVSVCRAARGVVRLCARARARVQRDRVHLVSRRRARLGVSAARRGVQAERRRHGDERVRRRARGRGRSSRARRSGAADATVPLESACQDAPSTPHPNARVHLNRRSSKRSNARRGLSSTSPPGTRRPRARHSRPRTRRAPRSARRRATSRGSTRRRATSRGSTRRGRARRRLQPPRRRASACRRRSSAAKP